MEGHITRCQAEPHLKNKATTGIIVVAFSFALNANPIMVPDQPRFYGRLLPNQTLSSSMDYYIIHKYKHF